MRRAPGRSCPMDCDNSILAKLKEFGTVLFTTADCPTSAKQMEALPASVHDGVKCGGSPDTASLCARLPGTPYWAVGGSGMAGVQTLATLDSFMDTVKATAKRLSDKKATMYGTEACIWTQRQKVVLGPFFNDHVKYVRCDVDAAACEEAGVDMVPAWNIDNTRYSGYLPLPQLRKAVGEEQ